LYEVAGLWSLGIIRKRRRRSAGDGRQTMPRCAQGDVTAEDPSQKEGGCRKRGPGAGYERRGGWTRRARRAAAEEGQAEGGQAVAAKEIRKEHQEETDERGRKRRRKGWYNTRVPAGRGGMEVGEAGCT
jgi:hypothetical protein